MIKYMFLLYSWKQSRIYCFNKEGERT